MLSWTVYVPRSSRQATLLLHGFRFMRSSAQARMRDIPARDEHFGLLTSALNDFQDTGTLDSLPP